MPETTGGGAARSAGDRDDPRLAIPAAHFGRSASREAARIRVISGLAGRIDVALLSGVPLRRERHGQVQAVDGRQPCWRDHRRGLSDSPADQHRRGRHARPGSAGAGRASRPAGPCWRGGSRRSFWSAGLGRCGWSRWSGRSARPSRRGWSCWPDRPAGPGRCGCSCWSGRPARPGRSARPSRGGWSCWPDRPAGPSR